MSKSLAVPSSGAVLGQRLAMAVLKAGLSSIPFASLALDAITGGLEFINDHAADAFLDELARRVERLELNDGMLSKPTQTAAHEALQQLMFEESDDYARDLARAVSELERTTEDQVVRAQLASLIGRMTSRYVVYLGAIYRFDRDVPTIKERRLSREVEPFPPGTFPGGSENMYELNHALNYILEREHLSASIEADIVSMADLGLIRLLNGGVKMIGDDPAPWKNNFVKMTPLGDFVLGAFREKMAGVPPYSLLY